MKKYILYFACILAILWGYTSCHTDKNSGHNHSHTEESNEHNHDHVGECGHNHDEEDHHNHQHEGDCDHDHDHNHEGHSHAQKGESSHEDEIAFTPEQAKTAGLEITEVTSSVFHQVIKTSGQILSAQGDEVTVSATASGIVSFSKSSLNEGLAVRKGESLLNISSRNMVDGDPALRAKSAFDIALREFERAESLIGDKLISEREYNETKLNYENARTAYEAIRGQASARGIAVSAPIAGFIKSRLVNEGQYVEAGQALMTVTQNLRLQLNADVSVRYYHNLGNIVSANFKMPYDDTVYRLSDLKGRLVSYGRSANSQDSYIPVTFEFDNIGQILSGSYVEVFLLGQSRNNVITIPVTSITEEQGIYFVYLQVHEDAYTKQEVKLGTSDGKNIEVLSGIKQGDRVVSKGAYHVKLASASASIPHAHEH